jgi:hypothetical protein
MQSLTLLAKLPRRAATDPEMVVAVYLIALEGVTRYALEKATRLIVQGRLGHPFMPSPPELRIECDRIMQPHQDLLTSQRERRERFTWAEDANKSEPPDAEARDRMTALWQSVRPMFESELKRDEAAKAKARTWERVEADLLATANQPIQITPALLRALEAKQKIEEDHHAEPGRNDGQGT